MKHLFHTAVATAAIAIFATPALAGTSASASIGPLTIRLVDLNTTDGVTPWITFRSLFEDESRVSVSLLLVDGGVEQEFTDVSPWAPNTATAAAPGVSAHASIAGNGTATGSTFSVFASATSADPLGASFNARAATPGGYGGNFQVSANTLVVIEANASASASVSGEAPSFVSVDSFLAFEGPGNLGFGQQYSTDSLGFYHRVDRDGNNFAGMQTRKLSVSFLNLQTTDATGTFSMAAATSGTYVPSPVPEPETYALMLAGLAAIGLMARRRT